MAPPNRTGQNKSNRLDPQYYKGRGPTDKLNNPTAYPTLIYPNDIGDLGHYVMFRVSKEYKFRSQQISAKNTLAGICLPVPQNLQTGYNANYANEDLGALGSTAADIAQGKSLRDITGKEAIDAAAQGALKMAGSEAAPLIAGLLGGAGGFGAALGIGGVVPAVTGALGIAVNPHQALLFQGTQFRTHSFSYKFMPRSREEAETLQKIIKLFKFHMAPELRNSNHFFEYPEQFDIDFKHKDVLFDIGTSVLTGFTVDYHGEGTPSYHGLNDDVQPTSFNINMEFQEVTITTKQNIKVQGR